MISFFYVFYIKWGFKVLFHVHLNKMKTYLTSGQYSSKVILINPTLLLGNNLINPTLLLGNKTLKLSWSNCYWAMKVQSQLCMSNLTLLLNNEALSIHKVSLVKYFLATWQWSCKVILTKSYLATGQ